MPRAVTRAGAVAGASFLLLRSVRESESESARGTRPVDIKFITCLKLLAV